MTIPVHLCSKCEAHPATVKVVKLQGGTARQIWLCASCAAAESPYSALPAPTPLPAAPKSLEDVLAGLFGKGSGEGAARPGATQDLVCSDCGLPFDAYKASLLLGCPGCYASFSDHLNGDLRKFHGSTLHRGRCPVAQSQPTALPEPAARAALPSPEMTQAEQDRLAIERLKRRLADAVEVEDYRLAADLKGQIQEIERRLSSRPAQTSIQPEAAADQAGESHGD